MRKQIYNTKNGLFYEKNGDYYTPCFTVPNRTPIGIWGQRRCEYLRNWKSGIYTGLLLSGKLNNYLAEIDLQAEKLFTLLITQMAEREGITEQLKTENQMEWVARMNNIRERATEIVNAELTFL